MGWINWTNRADSYRVHGVELVKIKRLLKVKIHHLHLVCT